MHILLIKTSSMGDVVHALPAVTDALKSIPNLKIDWMVERVFSDIPKAHSGVNKVIISNLRAWKKKPFLFLCDPSFKQFRADLKNQKYDLIIDAQGLLKSVFLGSFANYDQSIGYDFKSIREPCASFFYDKVYTVSKSLHAVERIRQLFAKALNYNLKDLKINYGLEYKYLDLNKIKIKINFKINLKTPYFLLFPCTTWESKHWPVERWRELILKLSQKSKSKIKILLAWGSEKEKKYVENIVQKISEKLLNIELTPQLSILEMMVYIAHPLNQGVVAVDTGFAHLSEAFDKPMVSLYGPTDVIKHGPVGLNQMGVNCKINLNNNLNKNNWMGCISCHKKNCVFEKNKQYKFKTARCMECLDSEWVFQVFKGKLNCPV